MSSIDYFGPEFNCLFGDGSHSIWGKMYAFLEEVETAAARTHAAVACARMAAAPKLKRALLAMGASPH